MVISSKSEVESTLRGRLLIHQLDIFIFYTPGMVIWYQKQCLVKLLVVYVRSVVCSLLRFLYLSLSQTSVEFIFKLREQTREKHIRYGNDGVVIVMMMVV